MNEFIAIFNLPEILPIKWEQLELIAQLSKPITKISTLLSVEKYLLYFFYLFFFFTM